MWSNFGYEQKKKNSNKNQRKKETPQHLRSAYEGNGPAKYASAECTKRKDPAPPRGMTRDHDNYEGSHGLALRKKLGVAGRVPFCRHHDFKGAINPAQPWSNEQSMQRLGESCRSMVESLQ